MTNHLSVASVKQKLLEETELDISDAVATMAASDPEFYRKIIAARHNPIWLRALMSLSPSTEESKDDPMPPIIKFAISQLNYAKHRFENSTDAEFEIRWNSCLSCKFLIENPGGVAYYLGKMLVSSDDNRVCSLCGCVAKAKAYRQHEICPGTDPDRSGFNRWGQHIK